MKKTPDDHRPPIPASSLTNAILESISDGVFTVDAQWRITSFNRAAEEITGVDREEAIGRPCFQKTSSPAPPTSASTPTSKSARPTKKKVAEFNASGNQQDDLLNLIL